MIIKHLLDERASTIYLLQDCFWGFESDFNKKKN
jgi:peptide methionine sulfoxide reductase MsrA